MWDGTHVLLQWLIYMRIDVYYTYITDGGTGGGDGVFLSRRQLDEAMAGSSNSPTKLIRNLLSVFTRETLAGSSAFRSCTNPPLDREIVSASIRKFIVIVVLALNTGSI